MSFGWANAWYNGLAADLDGKYANDVGHAIESTIMYIKPWDITQGATNPPSQWVTDFSNPSSPSRIRPFYVDLMVPWANEAVPKRDLSVTVDIAPAEPSGPGGHWISGPGGEDVAAITNWHNEMIAGIWDSAWIAFANMLVSFGGANWHVRPWHEPTWWNFWTSTVDYTGWLAAFNRMISVFRAHGLTGRMGPSLDGVSSANYLSSNFPGSDCAYYDTYTNAAPGHAVDPTVVSYCRSKGMVLNFSEIGVARYPDGSQDSDARGVAFFTEVHDWIQANPDVYEGMVYYNDNGSADITLGSYPSTLAYVRNNMATWEISAIPGGGGGGGGGVTGTNTASVQGSGSTAHFSGTAASNVVNIAIYRDTWGGTKIADITPSAGAWSYDLLNEVDGAHIYVIGMFDSAPNTPPGNVLFGPATYNLTTNSAAPSNITSKWTPQTASGSNGNFLGLNWSTLDHPPTPTVTAYLVLAIGSGGATPVIAGFTLDHRADNGTQVGLAHYYRPCDGSENGQITISNAGSSAPYGLMHAVLIGLDGVDRFVPIDAAGQDTTNLANSTGVTIPGITPTEPGVMYVGSAFVVRYNDAVSASWTPPGTVTEVADLFGTEGGVYGKSLEVVEHLQATQTPVAGVATTWGAQYSFGVASGIGFRAAAAVTPTQSMSNFSVFKDLGHVSIIVGTITSGIATVKVFDGATLVGTATPANSAATVSLAYPQAVGSHNYTVDGYDSNGNKVAGDYSVPVTVLDAPLIGNTQVMLGDVRINANAVTTQINIYRTVADGGALVTSHAVDAQLGWDYTSTATGYVAGRDYDATASDGTHESAKVRFTAAVAPIGVTAIDNLSVNSNAVVSITWEGGSLQIFDASLAVIDTVTTGQTVPNGTGGSAKLYARQLPFGHYIATVYDTADPTVATQQHSTPFDIGTYHFVTIGSPGQRLMKDAGGKVILIRT